ncbi:hypothetical protein [Formosa sp. 4Alg 33]|uniref:hypothetical protein n=1 Tax=Formosa sp. 4Alg 33 TaxID=3382189 RepID=UPI003D9C0D07
MISITVESLKKRRGATNTTKLATVIKMTRKENTPAPIPKSIIQRIILTNRKHPALYLLICTFSFILFWNSSLSNNGARLLVLYNM